MTFIDMIQNDDNGYLVDWNYYSEHQDICSFVIDENEGLTELGKVLDKLKSLDKDIRIYAYCYSTAYGEVNISLYSDILVLDTSLDCATLENAFKEYDTVGNPLRGIVPEVMNSMDECCIDTHLIPYVYTRDGEVATFSDWSSGLTRDHKCLLWD